MGSPLSDVMQGYATLGSSLVERWTAHAQAVASKLDDGYTADSAAADLAATASLAAESGFLLASETLDAIAILTLRQRGQHMVDSDEFSTSLPGATLELTGPLVNGLATDALPVSAVRIIPSAAGGQDDQPAGRPAVLGPAAKRFRLRADATGHRGSTYVGQVRASAAGKEPEAMTVWITVP